MDDENDVDKHNENNDDINTITINDAEETVMGTQDDATTLNLRQQMRMKYSADAIPEAITTSDVPALKEALANPELSMWEAAINKEIDIVNRNRTWIADILTQAFLPSVRNNPQA